MLSKHVLKKLFATQSLLLIITTGLNSEVCYSNPMTQQRNLSSFVGLHDTTKNVVTDSSLTITVAPKVSLNRHVARFVKSYVKKEDEFLQKMKGRSGSYFQTIEAVFQQYDLPVQLKYLAIVESQLRSNASSPAGARGLWQLMPVTAKELGLRIHGKTDERLYTYRSTVAAAKYLQNLYAEFGDWLLVLAAYNSGPGAVYKAVKKSGSHNFWALESYLPAESRGHVKRFIGIHYFFEGEGSVATQTKAEAKAWMQKWGAAQASL